MRPKLVYDGDCGFCTRSVELVERLSVPARLIPWQEADLAALRTTEARARHEVLWVAESGRVLGGAAAVAEVLRHARAPWPVLGWVMSLPLLRSAAEVTYRVAAANRSRLPGTTPACQRPEQERPGHHRV